MYKFGACTNLKARISPLTDRSVKVMNHILSWCFEYTVKIQVTILALASLNFVFGIARVATQDGIRGRLDIWLILVVSTGPYNCLQRHR